MVFIAELWRAKRACGAPWVSKFFNGRESRKGIEKGGATLLMSNVRGSTRETEKGGKISLKSNWRMNEREQEKIDAELATSGEEEGEKQQGETGVA